MKSHLPFMLLAFAVTFPAVLNAANPNAPRQLKVFAGEHDRVESIVNFELPDLPEGNYELQSGDVKTVLQVTGTEQATYIEPGLKKGESRTYDIAPASLEATSIQISAKVEDDLLTFVGKDTDKPLLSYQMKASAVPEGTPPIFSHGAHLHPVYSPAGHIVTGNYPSDHPHHRGIWMSWTKTSYEGRSPDFWNMGKDKSGKLTGEVRFGALLQQQKGPVFGEFLSSHDHIDHTSGAEKKVLSEAWAVKLYRDLTKPQALRIFDLTSIQGLIGTELLKLPKYHYGGLGVRGSGLWDAEDAVTMLTSNGDDRKGGDSKPAKWVYVGGQVDGETTGLVVLIHPNNFRFPQPLRLNPKNPQLSVAPSQQGEWAIVPGEELVLDYRFVAFDGKPDAKVLEKLWQDYAEPVQVEVIK